MINHLKFTEIDNKPNKTRLFEVYSNQSGDFLGRVKWRTGWRCYVMSYENNIDMSLSCLVELGNFINSLEMERYNKLEELRS